MRTLIYRERGAEAVLPALSYLLAGAVSLQEVQDAERVRFLLVLLGPDGDGLSLAAESWVGDALRTGVPIVILAPAKRVQRLIPTLAGLAAPLGSSLVTTPFSAYVEGRTSDDYRLHVSASIDTVASFLALRAERPAWGQASWGSLPTVRYHMRGT